MLTNKWTWAIYCSKET